MPAVSAAQRRLFGLAEHNPGKLYAKNAGLAKLPHQTLHDFASASEKNLPAKVNSPGRKYYGQK